MRRKIKKNDRWISLLELADTVLTLDYVWNGYGDKDRMQARGCSRYSQAFW
jgi:hypothetical protein